MLNRQSGGPAWIACPGVDMNICASNRNGWIPLLLCLLLAGVMVAPAKAIPSFESPEWRLPNPDRPYEMTSGTVLYDAQFALYDLEFRPSHPSQLDTPALSSDGSRLEFDSTFDINYTAVITRGTEPPHPVSGIGTARAVGVSRLDVNPPFTFPHPQVFDTELVSLNLFGLSPIPDVMFRESPTLRSTGVTIREDPCPVCAAPFTHWIISSYFDIYAEMSFNGGATWSPASDLIHVEQAPDGFPPGDYNHDKAVDASDYVAWKSALGQIGAGLAADGDWSGKVDQGDYDVWRANFGRTAPAVVSASDLSSVPEPAACGIAMGAVALLLLLRRATW